MKRKTFLEFMQEKKTEDPLTSKVSLGEDNPFKPFIVSNDPNSEFYGSNKNLSPLIGAFKRGGNWGWSKDDKSGEDKPVKITGKKLYLCGGALRDHLANKKPKNVELASSASADEIYHILTQNKFEFDKKDSQLCFWVKKKDKKGRPYSFCVKVKGDEFDLTIFTKNNNGDVEPGTHATDASSRDFTINSMYLLLSNDNGPNKELIDMHGGTRDLKNGRIATVGDMETKLKEDPKRVLRLARFLSRYGKPLPEEEKNIIRKSTEGLSKLDPADITDEFQKGLDYEDGDTRQYLQIYNDLGLLPFVFPGLNLDTELPKELRELGDKHAPLAWMLRKHGPQEIEAKLSDKFKPEALKKIVFLIKSLGMNQDMGADGLEDMTKSFVSSGVSSRKLKDWVTKLGGKHENVIDAFLQHASSPRVKVQTGGDITADFSDLVDPFTGNVKYDEVEERKNMMEWEQFRKILQFLI